MFEHTIFKEVPNQVVERALPASQAPEHLNLWDELLKACGYLATALPERSFSSEPYLYLDLANMTTGFLFYDPQSMELVYVFRVEQ